MSRGAGGVCDPGINRRCVMRACAMCAAVKCCAMVAKVEKGDELMTKDWRLHSVRITGFRVWITGVGARSICLCLCLSVQGVWASCYVRS